MDRNERIADFVTCIRWTDLPEPVRVKIRMSLMDSLGAALSGQLARVSGIAAEFVSNQESGRRSTILLNGERAAPALAAFANASAANALDTDDGLQYAYGHAGAQIFPTALALTEALNMDGSRMLAAMAVGYEVAARVGRCWHDHHEVYQACGSWGSVACSAVASNLMGLSREQTVHALGISEYFSPNAPMMRDVDHPAMVKHAIGWGAMTGVFSAELASLGYTGIPGIAGFDKYHDWIEDIGTTYLLPESVAWKGLGNACCAWAHAAMKGARRLMDENSIRLEDIERIRVEGFTETVRLGTKLPSTTEEAQFNVAWPVAAMLVDGEVGPRQMLEDRLSDPLVKGLAQKVELLECEDLNELHRLFKIGDKQGRFAARVTIDVKGGRKLESGLVDAGQQFPQTDWNERSIEEKFRHLAGFVLKKKALIDKIVDKIWHFEQTVDIAEFISLLKR